MFAQHVWRALAFSSVVALGLVLVSSRVFATDVDGNWKDQLIARVTALETLTGNQGKTIAALQAELQAETTARMNADSAEATARAAGDTATLASANGYTADEYAHAIRQLIGEPWDAELEPYRMAGDGAPPSRLVRVG